MVNAAHKLLAETAKEMARAVYDNTAKMSNAWYAANPDMEAFVEKLYPTLLERARTLLARTLKEGNLPEEQKEVIAEALILDHTLNRKDRRMMAAQRRAH